MDAIPAKVKPAKHISGLRVCKAVQPAESSYEGGISHYLLSRISIPSRQCFTVICMFPQICAKIVRFPKIDRFSPKKMQISQNNLQIFAFVGKQFQIFTKKKSTELRQKKLHFQKKSQNFRTAVYGAKFSNFRAHAYSKTQLFSNCRVFAPNRIA